MYAFEQKAGRYWEADGKRFLLSFSFPLLSFFFLIVIIIVAHMPFLSFQCWFFKEAFLSLFHPFDVKTRHRMEFHQWVPWWIDGVYIGGWPQQTVATIPFQSWWGFGGSHRRGVIIVLYTKNSGRRHWLFFSTFSHQSTESHRAGQSVLLSWHGP